MRIMRGSERNLRHIQEKLKSTNRVLIEISKELNRWKLEENKAWNVEWKVQKEMWQIQEKLRRTNWQTEYFEEDLKNSIVENSGDVKLVTWSEETISLRKNKRFRKKCCDRLRRNLKRQTEHLKKRSKELNQRKLGGCKACNMEWGKISLMKRERFRKKSCDRFRRNLKIQKILWEWWISKQLTNKIYRKLGTNTLWETEKEAWKKRRLVKLGEGNENTLRMWTGQAWRRKQEETWVGNPVQTWRGKH